MSVKDWQFLKSRVSENKEVEVDSKEIPRAIKGEGGRGKVSWRRMGTVFNLI